MIFCTSFPKCGTCFIRHILGLDDNDVTFVPLLLGKMDEPIHIRFYKNGISGHAACHPIILSMTKDMDRFCIIRDPRDAIVSWAHYVEKIRDDHVLANVEGVDVKHAEDRIATLIDILPPYIANWLDWPQYATTVRYEKLLSEPEKELVEVSKVLDIPLGVLVERSKFRGGETFRKGVAGEWRHEFTDEHIKAFNANFSEAMEKWGYQ